MTDRLAIIVGSIILACLLYDLIFNDANVTYFLLRKLMELIEWMAFWR